MFNNIKTIKYLYRKYLKPEKVRHMGVLLNLSTNKVSPWIKDAIYKGFYEFSEAKLIKENIEKSDIVLEIGGGIGFIGSVCKKAKSISIYEANPQLIKLIKENLILNNVEASTYNYAITSGNENSKEIGFYIGENFWNASLVKKENFKRIDVKTKSLKEILKKHDPTCLIIDVEGYEYKLLINAIFPNQIKKVLIEYHPKLLTQEQIKEIDNLFKINNFICKNNSRDSKFWVRQ